MEDGRACRVHRRDAEGRRCSATEAHNTPVDTPPYTGADSRATRGTGSRRTRMRHTTRARRVHTLARGTARSDGGERRQEGVRAPPESFADVSSLVTMYCL